MTYLFTLVALIMGIAVGGGWPERMEPVANGTGYLIRGIVALVPVLIVVALSPAVATLGRRGRAGRFASGVVAWYVASSALAGLFGLAVSALVFRIPWSVGTGGAAAEAAKMIAGFRAQTGASLPLLAIVLAVVVGALGVRWDALYRRLERINKALHSAGRFMALGMIPLILLFGITLGVRFGARLGGAHYLTMTAYTAGLCFAWWTFYQIVILKGLARVRLGPVLSAYYAPTALFAAGTCSSLATLPVNLTNIKRYGVRDEVADFVVPFGAVANLDASTLMYVAYAPFVMTHVFDLQLSVVTLLISWPALVLFTIAAPGLPAGMGTALWSATLFASMAGLDDPVRAEFIATWIALSGGLPDMFRTATNCTGDGFTAIVFDRWYDRIRGMANGNPGDLTR